MLELLFSFDFLKIIIPVITVILAWLLNERSKRRLEEFKRKEISYRKLLSTIKGYYEENNDDKLIEEFIEQVYLSWLYLPDDIINKIYKFIDTVHTDGKKFKSEDKTKASNELILSLRKDLISRKRVRKTKLKAENFRHLTISNTHKN